MPIRTEVSQLFWQSLVDQHNQTIQLNPNDAKAYSIRGIARAQLGDQNGAIADFTGAIQLDSNCAEAYRNRGMAYAQLGDVKST
jgi:regulator of sirC expression with transglutaminase-like and TPR domain